MPTLNLAKAKAAARFPYTQVDANGRVEIDPRLIIKYVSEYGVPRLVKDPIATVRVLFESGTPQMIQLLKSLWTHEVKQWQPMSESELVKRIRAAQSKKYSQRPSPCFSAADYCRSKMRGNDGQMYVSTPTNGYKSEKEEQAAFMAGTWKPSTCVWRQAANKLVIETLSFSDIQSSEVLFSF
jgi:hypothetical protein